MASFFFDQLFKSPLVFFIIAAVVLIVLAIIGKIPFPNTIDLVTWQRASLATFGVILIVFSVIVTPKGVAPPSGGSVTQQPTITPSPTVALTTTPSLQSSPSPEPSPTATSPQSCFYDTHQTGQSSSEPFTNFNVSKVCVLIIDSLRGNLNKTTWTEGGVYAFPSGIYNGFIYDGEYTLVGIQEAKAEFCQILQAVASRPGSALSHAGPLPGWGFSEEELLKKGDC